MKRAYQILSLTCVLVALTSATAVGGDQNVRYVNAAAELGGDGLSWGTAYRDLQEALAEAAEPGATVSEIQLAEGLYTPGLEREATFQLVSGVRVLGGHSGKIKETRERDPAVYITTLSGDLNGDDSPGPGRVAAFARYFRKSNPSLDPRAREFDLDSDNDVDEADFAALLVTENMDDNAFHVVTAEGVGPETILDGLVITGGVSADTGPVSERIGAGILGLAGAAPTIHDCVVTKNVVSNGRGAGIYDCDGPITSCRITRNYMGFIGGYGAGLYGCDGLIEDCFVAQNSRGSYGAGLAACNGTIKRCIIIENETDSDGDAGGLWNCDADISLCIIGANIGGDGGGLNGCDKTITSCLIVGNYAEAAGGGLNRCNATVSNCTIAQNFATFRGGGLFSCNGTLTNLIVWDNAIDPQGTADPQLSQCSVPRFSCIQGWTGGGEGNITDDPRWVGADSGAWTADSVYDPASDVTVFTNEGASWTPGAFVGKFIRPDLTWSISCAIFANSATTVTVPGNRSRPLEGDDYQIYDDHLGPLSPCINAGDPDSVFGPDERDIDGDMRFQECRVDMGADETPYIGSDCNTNGSSDACDSTAPGADCNTNAVPDVCDPAAPASMLVSAVSRKVHAGHGSVDISLNVGGRVQDGNVTTEPRAGGVEQVRLTFLPAPAYPQACLGVVLSQQACPGGTSQDYSPQPGGAVNAEVVGDEMVLTFTPALENGRTYKIDFGPALTSLSGQSLEFRVLRADITDDGEVNAADRSAVVGIWVSAGFSAETDINRDGQTNAGDRSAVVGAWTGRENCAP